MRRRRFLEFRVFHLTSSNFRIWSGLQDANIVAKYCHNSFRCSRTMFCPTDREQAILYEGPL